MVAGLVSVSPDGRTVIAVEARGSDPEVLGLEVADALLAQGAADVLKSRTIVTRVVVTRGDGGR